MAAPILQLDGFGVAFGERVVLAEIDLEVPRTGTVVIVGPGGAGKSTLLRTLVGFNDAQPALRTWGTVRVDGQVTSTARHRRRPSGTAGPTMGRRIALVMQEARFLTSTIRENLASGLPDRHKYTPLEQTVFLTGLLEQAGLADLVESLDADVMALSLGVQRRLAVTRAIASEPAVLCIDEGTAGLPEGEAAAFLEQVAAEAERRAVLFVTHNQQHARRLGGSTALIAGGRVAASGPTERFFTTPAAGPARDFVRTGGCRVPGPMAAPEDLEESVVQTILPVAAREVTSRFVGPRGFYWLKPQQLGGLPRPGIIAPLEEDLEALRRLGVTTLVTLEEEMTLASAVLKEFGLAHRFFPIPDMGAPSVERAAGICAEIDALMKARETVALHCRAGLGRTGTALASQLIWDGASAMEALELVRGLNPGFIQSRAQVDFLSRFEQHLRASGAVNLDLN